MNFIKTAKKLLLKLRLFSIVIFFLHTFSFQNIKSILKAFALYLYNNILTFSPIHFVRLFYLRHILRIKIGKKSFIHMGARLEGKILIGNNTVVGRNCILMGSIIIKNNVSITAETYIFTTSHIVDDPYFSCFYTSVIINDHAWIGARAIIQPGVEIGEGAIVGSGAVVTKNIPDFEIFAGVPAKRIGTRSKELKYTLNYSPFFQ